MVRRVNAERLAAMYGLREFLIEGGLMSYSVRSPDQFRRAAVPAPRAISCLSAGVDDRVRKSQALPIRTQRFSR